MPLSQSLWCPKRMRRIAIERILKGIQTCESSLHRARCTSHNLRGCDRWHTFDSAKKYWNDIWSLASSKFVPFRQFIACILAILWHIRNVQLTRDAAAKLPAAHAIFFISVFLCAHPKRMNASRSCSRSMGVFFFCNERCLPNEWKANWRHSWAANSSYRNCQSKLIGHQWKSMCCV